MNPVEEFLKEASWWEGVKSGLTLEHAGNLATRLGRKAESELTAGERIGHTAGSTVTRAGLIGGIAAGAGAGARGAEGLYDMATAERQHKKEHAAMLAAHPSLQEEDPAQVEMAFRSVRHLSPHLASDPLAAGSVVRNLLAYGRTEQGLTMPTETAKMLTEVHKNIAGNRSAPGTFMDAFTKNLGPAKVEKGPTVPINVNAFDPSLTGTRHTYFDPEMGEVGHEHRIFEREHRGVSREDPAETLANIFEKELKGPRHP